MLERLPYEAMILDLDGVLTDTRSLHFKAWQQTYQKFIDHEDSLANFSEKDYQRYVDGKPREEGIKSFLQSRGLSFSTEKIQEIGTEKNLIYQNLLHMEGPNVFTDALEAIEHWRSLGISIAVISSSQNCKLILREAGIADLFDACVDGEEGKILAMKGKPEPDYFLEAAKRIGKKPDECAIVEDSISGIMAGRKAHFKGVIGVSRKGQTPAENLYSCGADTVVSSLLEIGQVPNALVAWEDFKSRIGERDLALFIDFDGTLADIVSEPKNARIKESVRQTLEKCSKALKMAVISGRDRLDVKKLVGIDSLFYAGCHGFDMSGPGCFHYQVDEAQKILPQLEEATLATASALAGVKGIIIERKRYTTAVHYRMVTDTDESYIKDKVYRILDGFPRLKAKEGKKVIELFPDLDWDKGKATRKLCEILDVNPTQTVAIYIGDDLTDEDAFTELRGKGIGIKVDVTGTRPTKADYLLKDPGEVERFLNLLAFSYTGEEKRWRVGL